MGDSEREGGREVLLSDLATEVYVALWKLGFSSLTLRLSVGTIFTRPSSCLLTGGLAEGLGMRLVFWLHVTLSSPPPSLPSHLVFLPGDLCIAIYGDLQGSLPVWGWVVLVGWGECEGVMR